MTNGLFEQKVPDIKKTLVAGACLASEETIPGSRVRHYSSRAIVLGIWTRQETIFLVVLEFEYPEYLKPSSIYTDVLLFTES